MLYSTPDAPVHRKIDTSQEARNAAAYVDANARLRLNRNGRPVAIRRVVRLGQPGSFARTRYEAVLPDGVVALSHATLTAWDDECARPVN